jgi:hypothetical protein
MFGEGYVGASVPADMVAGALDGARAACKRAGRSGSPRLATICYFALGKGEEGRANVYDYYSVSAEFAEVVSANVGVTAADIRHLLTSFVAPTS